MTADDSDLAVRAAAGDRAAFEALVDRFGGRVRALALRMTGGNGAWADDLTQELFVHLLRVLPRYDAARPFAPWLFQVGANLFRNRMRDERRRPHVSLDALADGPVPFEFAGTAEDPATAAARNDDARRIRAARDGLPAAYREILSLRYEAGLSHEEISEALGGLPVGTVKNRLFRARAALAATLGISTEDAR
jgi:RNA polymerase sigma-70 factor (ECF subfamily)